MSVRTNLIDGKVINSDTHFSKYFETLSAAGVGEGMEVTSGSVAAGFCWVPCVRTNGETFCALVTNTSSFSISTSGTGYIIVTIPQEAIDDGSILNEDGTEIATIEFVSSLPTKNYLLLATITSGTIEDSRNIIPKITEIGEMVEEAKAQTEDLNTRVEVLEESGAVDHLEEMGLVGEKYTLSNTLFKQLTPSLDNSTVEANVGDVAANTEFHIQRQGSGTPSNKLKLKVKMAGSPTTSLKVEVRKGIQVDVSTTEAYWYGDSSNIIASGTVSYDSFSTSWQEITVNLDNEFGGTEGELLDVVLYQTAGSGAIVNSTNYYVIACDSTQWSEAFSYVSVNGTTRTRQKLMPYCISDGFAQSLLCKTSKNSLAVSGEHLVIDENKSYSTSSNSINEDKYVRGTQIRMVFDVSTTVSPNYSSRYSYVNIYDLSTGTKLYNKQGSNNLTGETISFTKTNQFGLIRINVGTTYSGRAGSLSNLKVYVTGLTLFKLSNWEGIPKKEGGLGEKISVVFYGETKNNGFQELKPFKETIADFSLNIGTNGGTRGICVPEDGYVTVTGSGSNNNVILQRNGKSITYISGSQPARMVFEVKKGDLITRYAGESSTCNFSYVQA